MSSVLKRALEFPSNVCIKPDVINPEKEDRLWMLLLWQPISLYSLSTYPARKSSAFQSFSSLHKISLQDYKTRPLEFCVYLSSHDSVQWLFVFGACKDSLSEMQWTQAYWHGVRFAGPLQTTERDDGVISMQACLLVRLGASVWWAVEWLTPWPNERVIKMWFLLFFHCNALPESCNVQDHLIMYIWFVLFFSLLLCTLLFCNFTKCKCCIILCVPIPFSETDS